MTDDELKKLVASLAISQAKTDEQIRELKEFQAETAEQIRTLGRQIGGLHNKFGSYVEALALPSMQRVLREKFGTDSFDARCKRRNKEGILMEADAVASTNSGTNQVFMVEVKSYLTQRGLQQTLKNLQRFKQFFPEHQDQELFGVLAYTDIEKEALKQQVLEHGIYLAHVFDGLFELQVSDTFQARAF